MQKVLLFVAGAMLLGLVPALAQTAVVDYPIRVVQEVTACGNVKQDVVMVQYIGGAGATEATLNDFMEKVVPASLLTNGALPAKAPVATMATNVTIPNAGKMCILGQKPPIPGYKKIDPRPVLPVSLRVRVKVMPDGQVCEDSHERFKGIVARPWKIESYFISTYTAVVRVTKDHVTKKYPHVQKKIVNGTYKKFNWVDP